MISDEKFKNAFWIPCEQRLPDKDGRYLVTILNREWNKDYTEIIAGAAPSKCEEEYSIRKDSYGQLSDGRWTYVDLRAYSADTKRFYGCGDIFLAWMELPEAYYK